MTSETELHIDSDTTWQEIENRLHPKNKSIDEVRAEYRALMEDNRDQEFGADVDDSLHARLRLLWSHLERELDAEYPDCPECHNINTWGAEPGGPIMCHECSLIPTGALRDQINDEWNRLIGDA